MNLYSSESRHSIAVIGANGYSGLELAKILLNHPYADLKICFVRDSNWELKSVLKHPKAAGVKIWDFKRVTEIAPHIHAVFLATPPEVSVELVPLLLPHTQVIDLSGAFRLGPTHFTRYYGLVPWNQYKGYSDKTFLISNPGCYATSALMALIPLLKDQLIDPSQIVIDAKSGTTGAGKKPHESLLFSEVEGECLPYQVGTHAHLAEIQEYAAWFSGTVIDLQMVTHLLPVRRGIISALYLKRNSKFFHATEIEFIHLIQSSYAKAYSNPSLVRFGALDKNPELLSLRSVVGSPRTHLSYTVKGNHVFIFSCIDNLLKGAASQAIENWNSQNNWPPETGLEQLEGIL